jgi:hypothetical protein
LLAPALSTLLGEAELAAEDEKFVFGKDTGMMRPPMVNQDDKACRYPLLSALEGKTLEHGSRLLLPFMMEASETKQESGFFLGASLYSSPLDGNDQDRFFHHALVLGHLIVTDSSGEVTNTMVMRGELIKAHFELLSFFENEKLSCF